MYAHTPIFNAFFISNIKIEECHTKGKKMYLSIYAFIYLCVSSESLFVFIAFPITTSSTQPEGGLNRSDYA